MMITRWSYKVAGFGWGSSVLLSFCLICFCHQVQELFHYEAEATKGFVMGVGMVRIKY